VKAAETLGVKALAIQSDSAFVQHEWEHAEAKGYRSDEDRAQTLADGVERRLDKRRATIELDSPKAPGIRAIVTVWCLAPCFDWESLSSRHPKRQHKRINSAACG